MTAGQKKRVNDYLAGCHRKAYKLGEWDCALFCADILECLTGQDLGAPYRGTYSTAEEYRQRLPVTLQELPEHLGMQSCPPRSGALFWMPAATPDGCLGIFWQGRALHPGSRGVMEATRDLSTLKFYSL